MGVVDDLLMDGTTWAWRLDIWGLGVRYYAGAAPPTLVVTGFPTLTYVDRNAIVRVSSQTQSIEPMGGIQVGGAITVTLQSRGDLADEYDPAKVLCRTGQDRGATMSTRLAQTLPHSAAALASVEVTDDLTNWPVTDTRYVFHVGSSSFRATGIAAGPPRFTGVTRQTFASRVDEHLSDAALGQQPFVTSEVVSWRSRHAVLYAAPYFGRALTSADYIAVARGILDKAPALAPDGLSVSVDLAPLTSVLDRAIDDDVLTTGLLHGYHYFEPGRGSVLAHTQVAVQAQLVDTQTTAATIAPIAALPTPIAQAQANTDLTRANGHPRRVPLQWSSGALTAAEIHEPTAFNPGPPETIGIGGATALNTPAGAHCMNVDVWDVTEYTPALLTATTVEWPDAFIRAANADWSPGAVAGATGRWADVAIIRDGDGWAVSAKLNGLAVAHGVNLEFRSDWSAPPSSEADRHGERRDDYFPGQGYVGRDTHEMLHYGLQFCAPDDDRWFDAREEAIEGTNRVRLDRRKGRWTRWIFAGRRRGHEAPRSVGAIRGPADAFYQTGERYILTKRAIFGSSSTAQKWVHVKWTEGGNAYEQVVKIASEAVHNDDLGNPIGYRLALADGWDRLTRSFGDWPGEARCEIRAAISWSNATAHNLLLEILHSGRGSGTNGAYDVLPFGCNLQTDDLDATSIIERAQPPIENKWTLILTPGGKKLRDLVMPLLHACGCTLAMRLDTNDKRQKLTLVPVGIETRSEVTASIATGEIGINGRPGASSDDRLTTRYQFELNHDRVTGEPVLRPVYTDAAARSEQGGDSETLTVSLRGQYVDASTDVIGRLQPLIDAMRARRGRPDRVYRVTLSRARALDLGLGEVVALTASDALDFDCVRGVTARACRVVGVEVDWWGSECKVTLRQFKAQTTGWAPAMKVDSVAGLDVTVLANAYTLSTHPLTRAAQTDIDYFEIGDVVRCVPRGNYAASVERTINNIVGNVITFNAAHGLSPGDTIRPGDYDATSVALRGYAFASDAAGKLGAANDTGTEYA